MATIENVNDRTILQQFHDLYKAVEEIKNKGINLNVKGQYESTTTYLQGDVVYNNGKAFYRINDGATTGIDTTNTEYWQMFFDAVSGLTGPQGPQGPKGEKGADGIGFNSATNMNVINNVITVDNKGINLEQTTGVTTQSNGTFEINTQSKLPITGSDTVVVDLATDGTHANIHLNADIKNKLDKALITPTSTPTATEIVAVDNTNSQTMLAIGDGLSVENGTLKVSGGSGNGKLYVHQINFKPYTTYTNDVTFYIISYNSNTLTNQELGNIINTSYSNTFYYSSISSTPYTTASTTTELYIPQWLSYNVGANNFTSSVYKISFEIVDNKINILKSSLTTQVSTFTDHVREKI